MTLENQELAEKGMKAFAEFESKYSPKLAKLDSFDQAEIKKLAEDMTLAMEGSQKATALQKEVDELKGRFEESKENQKRLESAINREVIAITPEQKSAEFGKKGAMLFKEFARARTSHTLELDHFLHDAEGKSDEKKSLTMEVKALTENSDPNGGYVVTPEFGGIIKTYVYETSPMRQYAKVINIGTSVMNFTLDNDQAGYQWVTETQARLDTATPTLGRLSIKANELSAMPNISQDLIDDAVVDIEAWVAGKVADAFSRAENAAFISGDGTNMPRGILTPATSITPATNATINSGTVQAVYSGSATGYTYAGLVALMANLKEPYQRKAIFMTQRMSMVSLLTIYDGQQRPIFNMNYDRNAGVGGTLFGVPVVFAADMPAVATNAYAMAYGDFSQAYQIVDRYGLRVIKDVYTNKPFVRFYTTKRVGGDILNYEAYKLMQIHA